MNNNVLELEYKETEDIKKSIGDIDNQIELEQIQINEWNNLKKLIRVLVSENIELKKENLKLNEEIDLEKVTRAKEDILYGFESDILNAATKIDRQRLVELLNMNTLRDVVDHISSHFFNILNKFLTEDFEKLLGVKVIGTTFSFLPSNYKAPLADPLLSVVTNDESKVGEKFYDNMNLPINRSNEYNEMIINNYVEDGKDSTVIISNELNEMLNEENISSEKNSCEITSQLAFADMIKNEEDNMNAYQFIVTDKVGKEERDWSDVRAIVNIITDSQSLEEISFYKNEKLVTAFKRSLSRILSTIELVTNMAIEIHELIEARKPLKKLFQTESIEKMIEKIDTTHVGAIAEEFKIFLRAKFTSGELNDVSELIKHTKFVVQEFHKKKLIDILDGISILLNDKLNTPLLILEGRLSMMESIDTMDLDKMKKIDLKKRSKKGITESMKKIDTTLKAVTQTFIDIIENDEFFKVEYLKGANILFSKHLQNMIESLESDENNTALKEATINKYSTVL